MSQIIQNTVFAEVIEEWLKQKEGKTLYRVDTDSWTSEEYERLDVAQAKFETTMDRKMGDGINEDSYVELVCSNDGFEDYSVIKRVVPIVDEKKMAIGTPREEGLDWDYWAKWKQVDNTVTVRIKKDVYWDNWGRLALVFKKGEVVEGLLHEDGTVSVESTIYSGISDYISSDLFELISM